MTDVGLRRWSPSEGVEGTTVPVSVVILTRDEDANIARCIEGAGWAEQIIVVDSGSRDHTCDIARATSAELIETYWRGFGGQREFALRLPELRHDWIFFLDADEWVSPQVVDSIRDAVRADEADAYWVYFRLIFQGRWIRHCGWYPSAKVVRLMKRSKTSYTVCEVFSEHPNVAGRVEPLGADIVDEDLKGLSSWLRKHVGYAELEAARRASRSSRKRMPYESRARHWVKDHVAPRMPLRPLTQFLYMYVLRRGFLDGRSGLTFCLHHAWFQMAVQDLIREAASENPER